MAEVLAQHLDVGDQMRGGVVLQAAQRARAAGAALVEDQDAPDIAGRRSGDAPRRRRRQGRRAGTAPAAVGVARLLPIHHMSAGQRQVAGLEWSDLGKQVASGHVDVLQHETRGGTGRDAAGLDGAGVGGRVRAVAMSAYVAHGLAGIDPRPVMSWRAAWRCRVGTRWPCLAPVSGRRGAGGWLTWPGRRSPSACCCSAARSISWGSGHVAGCCRTGGRDAADAGLAAAGRLRVVSAAARRAMMNGR